MPIFVGLTALLALCDGGLGSLILAIGVAAGGYKIAGVMLNEAPRAIAKQKLEQLDKDLTEKEIMHPDQVKGYRKDAQRKSKAIVRELKDGEQGGELVAKIIALGSFAFPAAGLAMTAGYVASKLQEKSVN